MAINQKMHPELLACEVIQQIHRRALTQPFPHFRELSCRYLVESLSLASASWDARLKTKQDDQYARWPNATDQGVTRTLTFQSAGDDSTNQIRIDLSAKTPDLPESFWQAISQSLVNLRDNIARTLTNSALNAPAESGVATVTRRGEVLDASPSFCELIRKEQPGWDGKSLPKELVQPKDRDSYGASWRSLYVHIIDDGDLLRLVVHPDRRKTSLTSREMAIASRIAKGCTFKQAGSELGISHSTVASHLYNIYAKLGIGRRSELVEWLNGQQARPNPHHIQ